MQHLDIISINLWQILISLCNLLLLYLLLKHFLYKPVKSFMETRRKNIDEQYMRAEEAENEAKEKNRLWDEKMENASHEADSLIKAAKTAADRKSDRIISEAKEKADIILKEAENEAELEMKRAKSQIKSEIVDISTALTEKMLNREINSDDHRAIISSVISEMGEYDDGDN